MKISYIHFAKVVLFCMAMVLFNACDLESDETTKKEENHNNNRPTEPEQLVEIKDGAIMAAFSVSETEKVYFSVGNLQYQASTQTWRFAENQWDYVGTQTKDAYLGAAGGTVEGSDNANISKTYNGWIDLFGWATSGWEGGADSCQPYSTSYYQTYYVLGGSTSNNMTGEYANADWGVYNAVSNGGNKAGMWRTLSQAEWNYLLFERQNADSLCSSGVVNGVKGLIILPDGWEKPWYVLFKPHNPDWCSSEYNYYSIYEWVDLQATGAVFLPVTGKRDRTAVQRAGDACYYWSSTAADYNAVGLYVFSDEIITQYTFGRSSGLAVRLVQDVK